MKEPREDDERLSALLEGRVEGRQREDLLAHLSAADDDYDVVTDTAAVLRALEEEDARARSGLAPPSMRRRGWPSMRTAAAMASAVVLLLVVGLALRGRGASSAGDPLQLAMRVDTAGGAPWTPEGTRGPDGRKTRDARSVYAGAKLVDLALAVRRRDTAQIHDLATSLQNELDRHTDRNNPLSRIAAQPDASANSLNALLKQATERYARDLERKSLELGAWAEAARLAAGAQNPEFFEDGASDGMLGRAGRLARGDAAATKAVADVRAALGQEGAAKWTALATHLGTMLSELVN